jgi:hypothetical protein
LEVSENIGSAIDYAQKMFRDLGRLVILIVLSIIPIVNFVVTGFFCKVIRETPTSSELPELKDYLAMWVQGLKVAVAAIVYMIVPSILIGFGAGFFAGYQGMITGVGIVTMIIGVILMFFIAIILAMAIVHMVKHNSFGKAFAVSEVLAIIRKIGWGKYILWLIIVFVLAIIVGAISMIPIIGWLISAIISPVFGVFASRSATLIYGEGASPAPPP